MPRIELPGELPVAAHRDAIIKAIRGHQVIIVCGETGSGKTTQLPKLAWLAREGQSQAQGRHPRRIGMTEPRRIAARSVAQRLAQETETQLGQFIGWKVRFTDEAGPATRIKVMTDGILLAETQGDPRLSAYDTIILDEAHERSLNIDFLLGFLHNLLPRRPDLKLILSSATLEADRFSKWFHGAPVIEVSGRSYPVEMRYRPIEEAEAAQEAADGDLHAALLAATDELARHGPGDILVFLPGEREIREAQEALRKHHPDHTEILPLFARLSIAEQDRIFQSHSGRRIVLATNVAETSLTVPGIRYVIDTGLARVKRYSLKNRIEQLKTEKIAQAQANQRAGRCGRLGPGVCIRLYAEADFQSRPNYPTPELLRSSLAGVILRMKSLALPDIADFPVLDAPEPRRIKDGQQLLAELGAIDVNNDAGNATTNALTETGRQLARLPVDPRIGRMLIAGHKHACLHEILVIAAFLSVQDPRERPMDRALAADEKHRRFAHPRSDFLAILNLWQHVSTQISHRKSQRKLREQLHGEFLSPLRIREWREVYNQLTSLVKELGFPTRDEAPTPGEDPWAARYAPIHQALLTGLLGNLGFLTEDGSFLGARDIRFLPFPGTGVKQKPKWIMAAEIVETRRVYARTVARVEPEWIEAAGAHLLKFSYSDPHWEKRPAQVNALLRATLYGLPVVNERRVHYGPIDPALCRDLFILHALVRGEWDSRAPFFRHNLDLLTELDELTQRTRNARIEVDEAAVAAFFAARTPEDIHNGAGFDRWRRGAEKANPRLLFLERADLFPAQHPGLDAHPEWLDWADQRWRLSYRFEPGAADDGVTLVAPIEALNQIPAARCEWLVPGLIEACIEALIRSLPQGLRRNFVPVPDYARAAAAALTPSDTPLTDALADFLETRSGARIPQDAWRIDALSPHLRMNFRLQGADGQRIDESRDLVALRDKHGHSAQASLASASTHLERDHLGHWDFDTLPEQISLQRGKQTLTAWPALVEEDDGSVSLRPLDHRDAALTAHRRGVLRLYWLGQGARLKQTHKTVADRIKTACLAYGLWGGSCETLLRDVLYAAALKLAPTDPATIRDSAAFEALSQIPSGALGSEAERIAQLAAQCIVSANALQGRIAKLPRTCAASAKDISQQLAGLVSVGFIASHPPQRLQHLPRYLTAIERRLEKLPRDLVRDTQNLCDMAPLIQAATTLKGDKATEFRWALEELRVSLFAQELKTPEPVSIKRLEKRLAEWKR